MVDRETIIDEIRRCAAENGGRPLGRERFEAATGIREHEWLGRYWTRWSDAVREAGFEPNAFQGPLDEGWVLDRLVSLIRDLGHFPTGAEQRMAARAEDFPSQRALTRLGSTKATLAARVAEHCRETGRLEDVLAIVEPLAAEAEQSTAGGGTVGYVYLVRSGAYYKIGRTAALGRREYELAIQLPERLELVHALETDDPAGIERYWHQRFADRHANGEWFRLTRDDVAAFKRRKRYM